LVPFTLLYSTQLTGQGQVVIQSTGTNASTNAFEVWNAIPSQMMIVRDDGNVGIGTPTPNFPLEVNGPISTTAVGFVFPDGTIQTTAAKPTPFSFVLTVAQSGGDYTTITAAINACISVPGPYLIRVMPGTYNENVTLLRGIYLKGAGKDVTIIQGSVSCNMGCTIDGFNIQGGIDCGGFSPTIINNAITNSASIGNSSTDGIIIMRTLPTSKPHPRIFNNDISGCAGNGIYCNLSFMAWISGNRIEYNNMHGILCDGSNPLITNNIIQENLLGGIKCYGTNPYKEDMTISNNKIISNNQFGISLSPNNTVPNSKHFKITINANTISNNGYTSGGSGIIIFENVEPKIIANDIFENEFGITINLDAFPSIIGNNINYNYEAGIDCYSSGGTNGTVFKPVIIDGNHIHSNCHAGAVSPAGIRVNNCSPIITHNDVVNNDDSNQPPTLPDIDYSSCSSSICPMISLNTYDIIFRGPTSAKGRYNVTSTGGAIAP
jgi:hypothetical protein